MSTRCNILIGNNQFYHHSNGYPEGVGQDLAYFLANVNDGKLGPWAKNTDEIAKYITEHGGIIGRLGMFNRGKDAGYEPENNGLHSDIEFLYLVNGRQGNYKLYCVDVWKYIDAHPTRSGETWNHPFYKLDAHRLQANFCTPEYEMKIPSSDVPEDERIYHVNAPISHKEAKYLGLTRELDYGGTDWETGIVRVRNAKRQYPCCPQCGRMMDPENMKFNAVDDGQYYEVYKCLCGQRFAAVYDTPDESGDWQIVSENARAKGFIGIMSTPNGKQIHTQAFPTQGDVARYIEQYTIGHRVLDYKIVPAAEVHQTYGFRDPTAVKGVDVAFVSRNIKGQKLKERPAFFSKWRRKE